MVNPMQNVLLFDLKLNRSNVVNIEALDNDQTVEINQPGMGEVSPIVIYIKYQTLS